MQKRVTLSLNDKTYQKFQEFCERNDIVLSKRIERLIEEHLDKRGKEEK
jgi:hypothetical protein